MTFKISAVMLTNDRSPRSNYVEASLNSLQARGLFKDHNFSFILVNTIPSDSNHLKFLDSFDNPVQVVQVDSRLHYNEAMAFSLDCATQIDCDVVLFMEDDIRVCRNFPQRVIEFVTAHGHGQVMCDFVTYYQEIADMFYQGATYLDMASEQFYGNQCVAFRKDAAVSYASFIRREADRKPGFADIWYSQWLEETYNIKTIRCAVPSLAQHIGMQSNHGHEYIIAPGFADDLEDSHAGNLIPTKSAKFHTVFTEDGAQLRKIESDKNLVAINQTALMVYSLCDGKRTLLDIIKFLVCDFPENEQEIRHQVPMAISELRNLGALQ